jgi:hypothetical protein
MADAKDFKEFIQRLKIGALDVYYRDVIKATTGCEVIEVNDDYNEIIKSIKNILKNNLKEISNSIKLNYIGRANELGNSLEGILADYINRINGFVTKRSVGYPDIILNANGKYIYIECKIYQEKTIDSSLRSFYLKVSKSSKIKHSCPHILIGFEVESLSGENKSPFILKDFKIVDLYNLKVNLKPEFNASNPMIYRDCKKI